MTCTFFDLSKRINKERVLTVIPLVGELNIFCRNRDRRQYQVFVRENFHIVISLSMRDGKSWRHWQTRTKKTVTRHRTASHFQSRRFRFFFVVLDIRPFGIFFLRSIFLFSRPTIVWNSFRPSFYSSAPSLESVSAFVCWTSARLRSRRTPRVWAVCGEYLYTTS